MEAGPKGLNSPNFRKGVEGMERSQLLLTNNIQYLPGARILNLIDKYWIRICKKMTMSIFAQACSNHSDHFPLVNKVN